MNKRSKVKTLEYKPRSGWLFLLLLLLFKCVRNVLEKAVSRCVIILQERKVTKNNLYNFKVSSKTVWRYMISKGWKALKRKRRRTCGHGVTRIWKLYSKRWPAGKLTWRKPPRDHLDYLWRDNIQRSSPKTTDELRQWLRLAWKNVPSDTLWQLLHSIPHHLWNVS